MAGLSLRLPEELETKLEAEARHAGLARSEVVRTAIAEFLARKDRERLMAAFVAEARAAYSDPAIRRDALELADEALALDNEGLRVAESRPSYASRHAARPAKHR